MASNANSECNENTRLGYGLLKKRFAGKNLKRLAWNISHLEQRYRNKKAEELQDFSLFLFAKYRRNYNCLYLPNIARKASALWSAVCCVLI